MIAITLCRERLDRLLRVLQRQGGSETVRQLVRSFGLWRWEIEQAEQLGWIALEIRKPPTGRPSLVAREVSNPTAAKLPPWRYQIPKPISHRHWLFALESIKAVKRGCNLIWHFPCFTEAYLAAYKGVKSRRGATVSASRVLRHPDVRATRAWFRAQMNRKVPIGEFMPESAVAIWERLRNV